MTQAESQIIENGTIDIDEVLHPLKDKKGLIDRVFYNIEKTFQDYKENKISEESLSCSLNQFIRIYELDFA